MVTRILSITKSDTGSMLLVGVTQDKKIVNIIDESQVTADLKSGDVIECIPSKVYGSSVTLQENSFIKKIQDEKIPTLSQMRTKIKDIKPSNDVYCIEAIILKSPEKREVQTKSGESISLSETFIEDDTGQIWLKGWRTQARLLEQFTQGEIISVTGVNAKPGLEGRTELFLTSFSVVSKKT
jgi:replication factor A1